MATEATVVTVGEREYPLRPFRGLKAISLMAAISGLVKTMPDIVDQVEAITQKHRKANVITMSRAYFELRFPEEKENVSEEAWQANGGEMTLPDPDASVDFMMIVLQILPTIMDEARDQVLNVMALVVIPDRELQEADENDQVTERLAAISKELLYNGTLEELAELALRSTELVKDQFQGKVKELVDQVSEMFGADETEEVKVATVETIPETPSEPSSTPSPAPTTGAEEKSSDSDGLTSKATSTA